ncbi:MAG: hypothetical protein VW715_14080 [Rhodospirillales bacterium]
MATTIKLKNGSGAPLAGDLVQGEPALDLTNKRLYTEDSGGTVIEVGTNPTSLTTGTFTSTGIDDNATSTAITITSGNDVGVGVVSPRAGYRVDIQESADNGLNIQAGNASSDIALAVGSASTADKFVIQAGGNVGIGTASPSRLLHLSGGDEELLRVQGNSAQLRVSSENANSTVDFDNVVTGGNISFSTVGSERMRIDSSGNVGIGTTSPTFTTGSGLEIQRTSATATLRLEYTGANGYELSAESGQVTYNSVSSLPHVFEIGSTEQMRIDSSGNVGIGTTSPAVELDVASAAPQVRLTDTDGGYCEVTNVSGNLLLQADKGNTQASSYMRFDVDNTEAMRIDSSGNLLVGKTSSSFGTAGIELQGDGELISTRAGTTAYFNRTSTDGDIVEFYKDGSTVGSIGSNSSGGSPLLDINAATSGSSLMRFTTSGTERMRIDSSGHLIVPNGVTLGTAAGTYAASNTLDDYEEGTWTPSVSAGAISGTSLSYAGTYTKIGRLVYIYFEVSSASSDVNIASYVSISGLPFTLTYPATGTAITEDIDVFDRQGFAVAIGTTLQISNAGSSSGTTSIFVGIVGTTS